MSIGKEREREGDICLADFYCFFSEPIFHRSPHPLLCSSEEHQELVHGNVRETEVLMTVPLISSYDLLRLHLAVSERLDSDFTVK